MRSGYLPMTATDEDDDRPLQSGDLTVWPDQFLATLAGEPLRLTHKEFLLLVLFVSNPGRLLRRERIGAEVWGAQVGRTIDIHVARLRARLPEGAIQTVVRLGYRFVLA